MKVINLNNILYNNNNNILDNNFTGEKMEGIIKVYRQEVPPMCFIGKKIHNFDFGVMFQPGGFDVLESFIDEDFKKIM